MSGRLNSLLAVAATGHEQLHFAFDLSHFTSQLGLEPALGLSQLEARLHGLFVVPGVTSEVRDGDDTPRDEGGSASLRFRHR